MPGYAAPEATILRANTPAASRTVAAQDLIRATWQEHGPGFAIVSSFGADSAVLLHLAASVDPRIPVLTLDTEKLFPATHRYRETLTAQLGLTDVRLLKPDAVAIATRDPLGLLFDQDPDACCAIRKVDPLAHALTGFSAWANGRRRDQADTRRGIAAVEQEDGRVKLSPLADWSAEEIEAYRLAHSLPVHPLVEHGYKSIGCMSCTTPVAEGEEARAGRWRGREKIECGLHQASPGVTPLPTPKPSQVSISGSGERVSHFPQAQSSPLLAPERLTDLDALEAQSIFIFREAFARIRPLALLWSLGKDSNVMIWLARKAFLGEIPFPVAHLDTGLEFDEAYAFRDTYAKEWNLNLIADSCPPIEATDPTLPPGARVAARKSLGLAQTVERYGFSGIFAASAAMSRRRGQKSACSARAAGWHLGRARPAAGVLGPVQRRFPARHPYPHPSAAALDRA
ncbi:phosphoadenylyl-sulfate reductase [Elstera litoralis]